jgi:hypothetical protein
MRAFAAGSLLVFAGEIVSGVLRKAARYAKAV